LAALDSLPAEIRDNAKRSFLRELESQGHIKSAKAFMTNASESFSSGAAVKKEKKKHPYHGASICKPKHRHTPRTVDDFSTGDWVAIGFVIALSVVCLTLLGVFLS
jgi:hypothetical protein